MRLSELKNVLDKFLANDKLSAILIDGEWGIGKTHFVTSFLEQLSKKKYKVAYSSLFGKKSIAEVNTDLYNDLAKIKKRILSVVNPVIKLTSIGVSTASGFNINLGGTEIGSYKIKKKKKHITVCVLDDLERNDSIKTDQLIGYINSLILQGIKVICLTYSKMLSLDDESELKLIEFKEKVFDRTYEINNKDNNVLKSILLDNYAFAEKSDFLNIQNIRTYIKSNALFNEIINQTAYDGDLQLFFLMCLAVVHEEASNKISSEYKEKIKKAQYQIYQYSSAMQNVFFQEGIVTDINLFEGIFNIYAKNDYTLFNALNNPKNEVDVLRPLLYLSDDERIPFIKKQEAYITEDVEMTKERRSVIITILNTWLNENNENEDIFSHVNKDNLFERLTSTKFNVDVYWDSKQSEEFIKEYNEYSIKKEFREFKNVLNLETDTGKIYEVITSLRKRNLNFNSDEQNELLEVLKSKDFFIKNIHGSMTEEAWKMAHIICMLTNKYVVFKQPIKDYLLDYKQKYMSDNQLRKRIDLLLKQYHLIGDSKLKTEE